MKDLKKISIALGSVILCLIVCDLIVGVVFDHLRHSLPIDGERTAKTEYVINKVDADIVIIGSSRALEHYDTYVFRDSLQDNTVFNCGGDGQKFWYCDIVTNCILNRYSPKVIIWDFRLSDLEPEEESLSLLYPYYNENAYIHDRLLQREPVLKYQLWCNAFRYNGSGSRILTASRLPKDTGKDKLGYSGHEPLKTVTMVFNDFNYKKKDPDSTKVAQLIKTILRAKEKKVEMVITISPVVNKIRGYNTTIETLKKICKECNVLFINDSQLKGIVGNPSMGFDSSHLNNVAAKAFTKTLINQIKSHHILTD